MNNSSFPIEVSSDNRNWIKYLIYAAIIVYVASIIAYILGWRGLT